MPKLRDSLIHEVATRARSMSVEQFEAFLAESDTTLTSRQCIDIALRTSEPVRTALIDQATTRRLSGKYSEAHAAAISGKDRHIQLALKRNVDWFDRRKGGHPIVLAASRGHLNVLEVMLSSGRDPSSQALVDAIAAAVEGGHQEIASLLFASYSPQGLDAERLLERIVQADEGDLVRRLLDAGTPISALALGRVASAKEEVFDAVLAHRPDRELSKEEWTAVARHRTSQHERLRRTIGTSTLTVDALEAVLRANLDPNTLAVFFERLPANFPRDQALMDGLTVIEDALQNSQIDTCKFLHQRGFEVPVDVVARESWVDHDAKVRWLGEMGVTLIPRTTLDMLREPPGDDGYAIASWVFSEETIVGLRVGMTEDEVRCLGFPVPLETYIRGPGYYFHRLEYTFTDGRISSVQYSLTSLTSDACGVVEEAAECLFDALSDALGDSKSKTWTTQSSDWSLRLTRDVEDFEPQQWLFLTARSRGTR